MKNLTRERLDALWGAHVAARVAEHRRRANDCPSEDALSVFAEDADAICELLANAVDDAETWCRWHEEAMR